MKVHLTNAQKTDKRVARQIERKWPGLREPLTNVTRTERNVVIKSLIFLSELVWGPMHGDRQSTSEALRRINPETEPRLLGMELY